MKTCCCCFTLREGGLIIASLAILSGFSILLSSFATSNHHIATGLFDILVGGLCFYGIRNNKDRFMLPYIILSWFGIFFLFVILIYIAADWFGDGVFKEGFIALFNPKNQAEKIEKIHILGIYYSVAWIVIFLSLALGMYFNIVMHFLYKTIRIDQRRLMPDYQQNYNIGFSSQAVGV